jgi:exopolysaccharide biosynthesis polyprenyl glycosylphosphotransferase
LHRPNDVSAIDTSHHLDAAAGSGALRAGPGRSARTRGWLVRRALLSADTVGLVSAFVVTAAIFGTRDRHTGASLSLLGEYVLFLATLPAWILAAKLYELYDRDEERTEHTTLDDFFGVLHLITVGVWILYVTTKLTGLAHPELPKVVTFWALSIVMVSGGRAVARFICRRLPAYRQNTVIVGAGEIGQLVARKFAQHPEYGINLVGFVDANPLDLREDLAGQRVLGAPDSLEQMVVDQNIERVVIAFSNERPEKTAELVARLKSLAVQIDIVPRLFDVVGQNVTVHDVEGLPLVGLPAPKLLPFSRTIKRAVDLVGASLLLVLTAPVFAIAAWKIKRDSPGPILFRQTRIGQGLKPFTALKFRTMKVDTDDSLHREFIKATMDSKATPTDNGLYKLERTDAVTSAGKWLRKTSLDELPQLLNVLRGDMSLVGPRPCLEYEIENFEPHHFERFRVPAGVTGLWQVTARAHSTFGEALDLDVAYARNWSLALDLWLLLRTPFVLLRPKVTA